LTVKIALFLSSDGIALAHRQPAGYWAMIGETAYDVPNLADALADLRALAVEREGETFETLLVLPDDQILYTSLTAPTSDPELTAYRIEEGLDGRWRVERLENGALFFSPHLEIFHSLLLAPVAS